MSASSSSNYSSSSAETPEPTKAPSSISAADVEASMLIAVGCAVSMLWLLLTLVSVQAIVRLVQRRYKPLLRPYFPLRLVVLVGIFVWGIGRTFVDLWWAVNIKHPAPVLLSLLLSDGFGRPVATVASFMILARPFTDFMFPGGLGRGFAASSAAATPMAKSATGSHDGDSSGSPGSQTYQAYAAHMRQMSAGGCGGCFDSPAEEPGMTRPPSGGERPTARASPNGGPADKPSFAATDANAAAGQQGVAAGAGPSPSIAAGSNAATLPTSTDTSLPVPGFGARRGGPAALTGPQYQAQYQAAAGMGMSPGSGGGTGAGANDDSLRVAGDNNSTGSSPSSIRNNGGPDAVTFDASGAPRGPTAAQGGRRQARLGAVGRSVIAGLRGRTLGIAGTGTAVPAGGPGHVSQLSQSGGAGAGVAGISPRSVGGSAANTVAPSPTADEFPHDIRHSRQHTAEMIAQHSRNASVGATSNANNAHNNGSELPVQPQHQRGLSVLDSPDAPGVLPVSVDAADLPTAHQRGPSLVSDQLSSMEPNSTTHRQAVIFGLGTTQSATAINPSTGAEYTIGGSPLDGEDGFSMSASGHVAMWQRVARRNIVFEWRNLVAVGVVVAWLGLFILFTATAGADASEAKPVDPAPQTPATQQQERSGAAKAVVDPQLAGQRSEQKQSTAVALAMQVQQRGLTTQDTGADAELSEETRGYVDGTGGTVLRECKYEKRNTAVCILMFRDDADKVHVLPPRTFMAMGLLLSTLSALAWWHFGNAHLDRALINKHSKRVFRVYHIVGVVAAVTAAVARALFIVKDCRSTPSGYAVVSIGSDAGDIVFAAVLLIRAARFAPSVSPALTAQLLQRQAEAARRTSDDDNDADATGTRSNRYKNAGRADGNSDAESADSDRTTRYVGGGGGSRRISGQSPYSYDLGHGGGHGAQQGRYHHHDSHNPGDIVLELP